MDQSSLFSSCLEKQKNLKEIFSYCASTEKRYEKIIELGKSLKTYPQELMTPSYLVSGCQSRMYLYAQLEAGKMHYRAHSDALISAGLAGLLLFVYDQEPPETLLQYPPLFLNELGITASLSPSRSNGLSSLFNKMRYEALRCLAQASK